MVKKIKSKRWQEYIVIAIPVFIALWVWLSALAFVPVPWPDDSAFYFVAKELFKWPPRWVMLPQAPFEPTYRIFNFNTMPLYPILIGLGRWIGIDGSFLLKLWPLGAWALSGSLLAFTLFRKGLPFLACGLLAFVFALDPAERWASVLVRPESLIGLFGMALILGLTFGFPKKLHAKGLWDPASACLALAAYAHFNAIHLVIPVVLAYLYQPKKMIKTGLITALYLSPWLITVLIRFDLFQHQMATQWQRLDVPNGWLSSPSSAISGLFQALGSPEPWPPVLEWAAVGMWILILTAFIYSGISFISERKQRAATLISLRPSIGWVFGGIWIFHSKPEVWFIYYLHIALWCFVGIAALKLWNSASEKKHLWMSGYFTALVPILFIFAYVDISQADRLSKTQTWNWNTYNQYVDCVENQLVMLEKQLSSPKPFRVWCPTFPDITIELSRKHPDWELTRTNDFWSRVNLAIQHGWDTEAVVVTEMINWAERDVAAPAEKVPEIQSTWMHWRDYFLNRLWIAPNWKPNRFICQKGRWQAFIFMKSLEKK